MNVDADAVRCGGKGAIRIAVAKSSLADHVTFDRRMQNRRAGGSRGKRIDHRRQWPIRDLDKVKRVFGAVAVGGDDHRDRLAHITCALDGDRPAFDRCFDADHETRGQRLDVGAGENRENAIGGSRRRAIDAFDFRVRVR